LHPPNEAQFENLPNNAKVQINKQRHNARGCEVETAARNAWFCDTNGKTMHFSAKNEFFSQKIYYI
jgi:hypothetical protein